MRRRRTPMDREFYLRARRRVGSNPDMVSPIGASHCLTPIDADCPPSGRAGHNNRRIHQYGGFAAEYNGRSGVRASNISFSGRKVLCSRYFRLVPERHNRGCATVNSPEPTRMSKRKVRALSADKRRWAFLRKSRLGFSVIKGKPKLLEFTCRDLSTTRSR